MSLIPMMKLRLAAPEHLVDLGRIKDLNYIREEGGALHIGATTTHSRRRELAAGPRQVPAAGGDRLAHRRPAGAQHGHHRRQRRACRSGGRLSCRAAGARSQVVLNGASSRTHGGRGGFLRRHLHYRARARRNRARGHRPVRGCRRREPAIRRWLQPASGFAIVGIAVARSQERRQDHDGAHRRHRAFDQGLPRDACGEGAGRRAPVGCRCRQPRPWWPRESTPTPTCTPRPITASTWRASTRRGRSPPRSRGHA